MRIGTHTQRGGALKKLLFVLMMLFGVVLLGVMFTYLLWFRPAALERPAIEQDYLAQWQGPELAGPPEDHAWPVMVEAFVQLGEPPSKELESWGGRAIQIDLNLRPGDPDWELLNGYLNQIEVNAALDSLREVIERPVLGYPHSIDNDPVFQAAIQRIYGESDSDPAPTSVESSVQPSLYSVTLPYLSVARNQGRLLMARAYQTGLASPSGSYESAQDFEVTLALARHLERQRGGIVSRAGLEIAGVAAAGLLEILARDAAGVNPETLARLDEVLAAWQQRPAVEVFAYAGLVDRDLLQRVYNARGSMTAVGAVALAEESWSPGETPLIHRTEDGLKNQPFPIQATGVIMRGNFPAQNELEPHLKAFEPLVAAFAELEPWEADPAAEPVKQIYEVARAMQVFGNMPLQLGYAHQIATSLTKAATNTVSQVSAARLVIAMIQHRQQTGNWPTATDELGDDADWPDGFTGKPLRLAAVDGVPTVFSYGTDRDFDRGRPSPNAGDFLWPNNAAEMVQARPADFDGDWILWTPDWHERQTAAREAAAAEAAAEFEDDD